MTALLLSLPPSSPDEPLKWQYVDQFVSESGVRARDTCDAAWMGLSSRRGSRSQREGLPQKCEFRGFGQAPRASRMSLRVVGPQPGPAGADIAPRDRTASGLMWGQCLL